VRLVQRAIVAALPVVPRRIVRRLSSRYIAGPSLDDAIRVVARLNAEGKLATIDVLGEEISSPQEARAIVDAYHEVLARVQAEQLDANVSVKLSGFGLGLGEEICRRNLEAVVQDARERSTYVRIDMEDSATTDVTLRLYRELRAAGHENLGVVLQSRLRRSFADVAGLDDVRLCKGIYVEPELIAFQGYDEVRASYVRCLEALLAAGAYVGIATHDEFLLGEALRLVREHGLSRDQYEFQMLLGVRPERGDQLVREGHRLRVYVPFGAHWYEYSLRRLQENPQIAGYVAADLVRGMQPRMSRGV
jgi:proline dehydrogenase